MLDYFCNSSYKLVVLINGFYKEQKVEFSHAVRPGFYRGVFVYIKLEMRANNFKLQPDCFL